MASSTRPPFSGPWADDALVEGAGVGSADDEATLVDGACAETGVGMDDVDEGPALRACSVSSGCAGMLVVVVEDEDGAIVAAAGAPSESMSMRRRSSID